MLVEAKKKTIYRINMFRTTKPDLYVSMELSLLAILAEAVDLRPIFFCLLMIAGQ